MQYLAFIIVFRIFGNCNIDKFVNPRLFVVRNTLNESFTNEANSFSHSNRYSLLIEVALKSQNHQYMLDVNQCSRNMAYRWCSRYNNNVCGCNAIEFDYYANCVQIASDWSSGSINTFQIRYVFGGFYGF